MTMSQAPYTIAAVRTPADLADAIALFTSYAAGLGVDLAYQGFADELASMPGNYAPPGGELLLARGIDGAPLGCVALRPMDQPGCCEMKRLYVAPAARGTGLGRALTLAVIAAAERIGYSELRLDTLPTMDQAIGLYRSLGFAPIAPYYDTPIAGTRFLAKKLPASQRP
jgi:ribosomal protein S18 acetylase RimI-like enzyme